SMAHGLEARVPFLSTTLLEVAWRIPAENKLHPSGVEKWILREVARPLLPAAIADRAKAKFAIGTGVGPTLEAYAEAVIPDDEFAAEAEAYARHGIDLATKEACLYFRHFRQAFGEHTLRAARLVGQSRSLNPDQLYGSAARRGA
ncbi:MAG TPA: asparagine synthase-related protein, partial [Bacillota bacterium]